MTTSTVHRTCTALAYRLRSDRSHEVEDQCLDKIHFTKPSSIFEVLEVILYISFETGTSFEINKMPSFHEIFLVNWYQIWQNQYKFFMNSFRIMKNCRFYMDFLYY